MISEPRLITRIALFSALVYICSLAFAFVPNVNPIFFIVFLSGLIWGWRAGMLVGAIGMLLWTLLNPYGPAPWPVAFSQIIGASLCGLVGVFPGRLISFGESRKRNLALLILSAILTTYVFFIPVNLADAWLFQPFWPRFLGGMAASLVSLASNLVIFPLLFPVARRLYERESIYAWPKR